MQHTERIRRAPRLRALVTLAATVVGLNGIHTQVTAPTPVTTSSNLLDADVGPSRTVCATTDGHELQALYVRTPGGTPLGAADLASIREMISGTQRIFDLSSRAHGAAEARLPRFRTDADCRATVEEVVVPEDQLLTDEWVWPTDAIAEAGVEPDAVWVAFYDLPRTTSIGCGIGTNYDDDRADPALNHNALAPGVTPVPGFAGMVRRCWTAGVTAHEVGHVLGAVQPSAPNATSRSHCTDGLDVMCYADGSGSTYLNDVCDQQWETLFDCNGDDYFNPTPTAGSYLANHWNIWDSPYLFPAPLDATSPDGPVAEDPTAEDPVATPAVRDVSDRCGPVTSQPFPDVPADGVHARAIQCLAELGITLGFADGTFRPSATVTEAQVATFLVRSLRAAGAPLPAAPSLSCPDRVHGDDIAMLVDLHWNGCGQRGSSITRSAMADVVAGTARWPQPPAADGSDWFTDDDGHPGEAAHGTLGDDGVVVGSGGRFRPDDTLTRGEMASILARAHDVSADHHG